MAEPAARSAREEGAALLTVLLLVAVMAVVTAVALERLTLASRMARNGVAADQGRALLVAGETIAAYRLGDLVAARPGKTTLAGGWLDTAQAVPVPGGTVSARVHDAGNCFNVNSLVSGIGAATLPGGAATGGGDAAGYAARPIGIRQFASLMRLLGTDPRVAAQVATASADWIDSDAVPGPGGAEDDRYLSRAAPYRTAGTLLADPTELRAVEGMTPALYQRLAPWLCALPVPDLSPINMNTLLPEQSVLLAMLTDGQLSPEGARQVLARRPADGYGSLVTFWGQPALAPLGLSPEVTGQVRLASRWFALDLRVDLGGTDVSESAMFDAQDAPARLVRRRWGDDG